MQFALAEEEVVTQQLKALYAQRWQHPHNSDVCLGPERLRQRLAACTPHVLKVRQYATHVCRLSPVHGPRALHVVGHVPKHH